jgi:hypothetical protein
MEVQSIQRVTNFVRDAIVVKQYSQVYDPKINRTYYECVTYTYRGTLDTYRDKGQSVDIRT